MSRNEPGGRCTRTGDAACRDEAEAAREAVGSPSCGCTSPTSTG